MASVEVLRTMNDDTEILWRQYNLYVDLYKFYMEVVLKLNIFFYAITGGILTFYLAHPGIALIRYALLLPALMSLAFSGVFFYGARLLRPVRHDLFRIRDALKLETAPDIHILMV